MKIRMLKTQRGSPDGVRVETYEAGVEYELGDSEREKDLVRVFLREGWAEEAPPPAREQAIAPPVDEALGDVPRSASRRRR